MNPKKSFIPALILFCAAFFIGAPHALANDDPFEYHDPSWINNVPSTSFWGLRGLTQTVSAEPLGMGRINIAYYTSYFKQEQELAGGTPDKGTNVTTMRGALSWGVNDNIDLFGVIPFYILGEPEKSIRSSLGQLQGGAQFTIPIPPELPLRLAGQIHFIYGLRAGNWESADITTNMEYLRDKNANDSLLSYAGFDYFEARKQDHLDLVIKVPLSLVAGNNRRGIKLHLNPGFAGTPGTVNDWLLLLAAGLQIDPIEFTTIGFEANLRTLIGTPSFTDPLWITPSLMFRSPYYANGLLGMSLIVGADFSVSAEDTKKLTRPLEPWRMFGDIVFSFDFLASKRREAARQARESAAEKARLAREAELSAAQRDSIARQAREDSLRLATDAAERARQDSIRAAHVADSLAAIMTDQAERARADSIAHAQREMEHAQREMAHAQREAEMEAQRIADSITHAEAMAEAQKKLEEERARRSEAEQMLLSTGMLVLEAVYFQTGRADLHINSRPYLTTIARMLAKYPKLRIEIGGHTDNTGSLESNVRLSTQRAESVTMFMINAEPALAQMLSSRGYGPSVPKADNNTAAGREMNRRVELKVLNPDVLQEYNP